VTYTVFLLLTDPRRFHNTRHVFHQFGLGFTCRLFREEQFVGNVPPHMPIDLFSLEPISCLCPAFLCISDFHVEFPSAQYPLWRQRSTHSEIPYYPSIVVAQSTVFAEANRLRTFLLLHYFHQCFVINKRSPPSLLCYAGELEGIMI